MEVFKNNQAFIDYLLETGDSQEIQVMTMEKNTYAVTTFEKANHLFFLTEGVLAVEVEAASNYYISSFIFENDFFGLDSFSSYQTKEHAIKVISTEAEIIKIQKAYLLSMLNKSPHFYELLLANFSDIFQRHYRFFELLSLPPKERVKAVLTYLSDFTAEIDEQEQLVLPAFFTQEVLARFCRTSQPRISVCVKELYQEGFLTRKKVPFTLV